MSRRPRRKIRRTTRTIHHNAPRLETREINLLRWFVACLQLFGCELGEIMRKKRP